MTPTQRIAQSRTYVGKDAYMHLQEAIYEMAALEVKISKLWKEIGIYNEAVGLSRTRIIEFKEDIIDCMDTKEREYLERKNEEFFT